MMYGTYIYLKDNLWFKNHTRIQYHFSGIFIDEIWYKLCILQSIRCTIIREAGVSKHHGGSIEGPLKAPGPSQQYCVVARSFEVQSHYMQFWSCHFGSATWSREITEKSFRNLIKSNWNRIVFTIFQLIWSQAYTVRLDPN